MSSISDFLSKNARPDRVKQFEQMSAGKSKQEVRELEMAMLEPEPIPEYMGEELRYIINSEFAVKFIFKDQEEMDFFGKFVKIAVYHERSITNMKIIMDLFHSIENGEISYDKKTGKFTCLKGDIATETVKETIKPVAETAKEPENNVVISPGRKLLRRTTG